MKKKIIVLLVLIIILVNLTSADEKIKIKDKPLNYGFSIWGNSYTAVDNIIGGFYLSSGLNFMTSTMYFSSTYNTNIMTNYFTDRLIQTNIDYKIIQIDETVCTAFGVSHVINLRDGYNYIGISLIPISSWKEAFADDAGASIHFLPINVLYSLESGKLLWSLEFIKFDFFY